MVRSQHSKRTDYVLLACFGILLVFGLLMLTSASTAIGYNTFHDRYFFIKRQLLLGVVPGIFACLVAAKLPYAFVRKLSLPLFAISLVMLVLVCIPGIGSTLNTNARSWLVVAGFSFQPSELAKLAVIFYLAAYLQKIGSSIQDFRTGFVPALIVGMLPIFLTLLQPDVGTCAIMFGIVTTILFVAGAKVQHLGLLFAGGAAVLVIMVALAPYRADRLMTFLHPELDPQGKGYQMNQAFLAIGTGGAFGLGYNHSRQKFQYLPQVHADSIFAIMAEEMGFFFCVAFIALLVYISYRGLKLAKKVPDQFGRLLVSGIIAWFMIQSFLNIGAIIGLLPLTGVPLPFVSHGGTSLMIALSAVGFMLNVSREATA
jgi:cell division protein FtsW